MEKQKINLVSRKDLDISYYIGPGHGGQNKQKTASGVQIIHRESGAIGRNSETRSQEQNKHAAFKRMTEHPKFKFWLARKLYEIKQNETIEETVERDAAPENLKFEILDEQGRWTEVDSSYFETKESKAEQ